MKFISIRKKLSTLTTRILFVTILGLVLVTTIVEIVLANNLLRKTHIHLKSQLKNKSKEYVRHNSIVLQNMIALKDTALLKDIIVSVVKGDEDILYGIFMDATRYAWVLAIQPEKIPSLNMLNPNNLIDSMSLWADTVTDYGIKNIEIKEGELFETVAPVIVSGKKLGVIRFGMTTKKIEEKIKIMQGVMIRDAGVTSIVVALLCFSILFFVMKVMNNQACAITQPLYELTQAANTISQGEYSKPVTTISDDEIGILAQNFEAMRQTVRLYIDNLENMVQQRTSQLTTVQNELVEKAHQAGMADVATGTLHNVGNILNSVKTSTQIITDIMEDSHLKNLTRANTLLRKNIDHIEEFICQSEKGKKLMHYYLKIEEGFQFDYNKILKHMDRLNGKINAIVEVVEAQQSYAGTRSLSEVYPIASIIDDALTMQAGSIDHYHIEIQKEFVDTPSIRVQKTKLVHIFINLINNAKQAMVQIPENERKLVIRLENENKQTVIIKFTDTGQGIDSKDLQKIFSHGYTTKHNGHGFGLHSSANYMTEMNGKMWAESKGIGRGATFVLQFFFTDY